VLHRAYERHCLTLIGVHLDPNKLRPASCAIRPTRKPVTKVEHRAPEVQIGPQGKPTAPVINIMDALKASMQKQGQAKVRDAVRKRMGKAAPKEIEPRAARGQSRARPASRRTLH
jgi:hypothetical protein